MASFRRGHQFFKFTGNGNHNLIPTASTQKHNILDKKVPDSIQLHCDLASTPSAASMDTIHNPLVPTQTDDDDATSKVNEENPSNSTKHVHDQQLL